MKLYHGALQHVKNPTIEKGRPSTDFGKGFYTTTNFEQARSWALNKQKTVGGKTKAIVNIYEIDDEILNYKKFKIRKFDSPDGEWLAFVIKCRNSELHDYDIVFGAVADDKIYTTITLYESNILTAEETISRLKVNEYYNQISFHSDEALSNLKYINSEYVSK